MHEGGGRVTLASATQPGSLTDTDTPAGEAETAWCVFCHTPGTTPGALPCTRTVLPPADVVLRLEQGGQPPGALRGTWPPMPARGPPVHG